MKTLTLVLLITFFLCPVPCSAQILSSQTAELDIYVENDIGQTMSLTRKSEDIPLLLVYDYNIIESDKRQNGSSVQKHYSKKELAVIIRMKPREIKAYRLLKDNEATSIYGYRGINGVLEVISPSMYRKLKKEGMLENYKPAKKRKPVTCD